ncbi:MAG TPA: DUF58 domain-containing protein [Anaerolineales bacterium]|nr:DUF58 domain-containing protein [Anaerolineales bacterium]
MDELTDSTVKVTIQLKVRWLPWVVGAFAVIQQLWPGKVWMGLSTVFAGVWLLAFLWAKNLAAGIRITREHKYGWNQVGDVFEERIFLENRSIFPALWLAIEDGSTLVGHNISLGTGIGGMSSRRWTKRTACERRGEYHLGPTRLETGDLFGIYRVTVSNNDQFSFVVAPPAITLPANIQIAVGKTIQDNRSMHKNTEMSTVSVSTREFATGDSLKRIHWLISAKKDVPHVRQFENVHASDSCWIVLDLDADVHTGSAEMDSLEHGIILAVSLANRLLIDGLAVGLVSQGSGFVLLPMGKGRVQFRQFQRILASIEPGSESLQNLFARSLRHLGGEHNVVVVTPSKDTGWLSILSPFGKRKVHPTIFSLVTDQDQPEELSRFARQVERYGVTQLTIPPALFKTEEVTPGRQGVVRWQYTPLGRAIKVIGKVDGGAGD